MCVHRATCSQLQFSIHTCHWTSSYERKCFGVGYWKKIVLIPECGSQCSLPFPHSASRSCHSFAVLLPTGKQQKCSPLPFIRWSTTLSHFTQATRWHWSTVLLATQNVVHQLFHYETDHEMQALLFGHLFTTEIYFYLQYMDDINSSQYNVIKCTVSSHFLLIIISCNYYP